ncbi:MAG: patatin-like phospholipase family protein [Acidobacteria bacterium]|nr:patatin-like phospholipase family protein [Acidobacteriota bacterium]
MKTVRKNSGFWTSLRWWTKPPAPPSPGDPPRIGLALGGGFARGIAHVGVLRVLEQNRIPVHCIAGVSAGAMVAAAFASGTSPEEIGSIGCSMRFADVARWSICRMGFAASERMVKFLQKLLKCFRFEEMVVSLGVLATDLASGDPVLFQGEGDVVLPIRASCSYPGLFQPVRCGERLLVDGAMSMEVPAQMARQLGANYVISVQLPMQGPAMAPSNMFQVVNRCFQIMQRQTEQKWRRESDLTIVPDVRGIAWDGFTNGLQLIEAGEKAALAALPEIEKTLSRADSQRGADPLVRRPAPWPA